LESFLEGGFEVGRDFEGDADGEPFHDLIDGQEGVEID
jgi:hypothetical protein